MISACKHKLVIGTPRIFNSRSMCDYDNLFIALTLNKLVSSNSLTITHFTIPKHCIITFKDFDGISNVFVLFVTEFYCFMCLLNRNRNLSCYNAKFSFFNGFNSRFSVFKRNLIPFTRLTAF